MNNFDRVINLARLLGVPVRLVDENTFATKRRNTDIAKLAKKLGVNYIVDYEAKELRTYELKANKKQNSNH